MEHGNIAAGYRTDLNNLINKFEQKKSARYSDFVSTWHELEFWRLGYGRKLEHDKAEFMEDVFQITVEYLSSTSFEAIVVITALYTLNGLWHCQRMVNKHRIRLSYRQYQQLDQFARQMASQGHTDFFAVYKRMLLERAFDIAIFTSPFMLGQFWKMETGEGDVDEVSGHIIDDEFHQFSSATVLDRLRKRCEPAFATYQHHQTKLLRDLPPDQEPIEFAKNVSPADQLGDTCAKIAQLEHQLSGVDLELKYGNEIGNRRRRIRERAMERGTLAVAVLNDSDASISPTKQVAINEGINRETELLDSYKPKYVLSQAAPKSVQRLKRGRPFVKGVEEREYSQTDFRGGIFKVAGLSKREQKKKAKRGAKCQGDSGISSPGSVDQDSNVDIVSRIEQYVDNQLAPLKKQLENEERAKHIQQHMEELAEAQAMIEAKKMSKKKRDEMRKRMMKAKKQLEKRKQEIENGEQEEEEAPKRKTKKTKKRKITEKVNELVPIKEEDIVASIKKEVEQEDDDDDSDDDKPLALMAPPKKKKTPIKKAKLTDLKKLKENDYVMVDPIGLDHSMLPETRPLIAQIVEVNREDEYIEARWMKMKTSSIGKMLYEYAWHVDARQESTQLCLDDLFEKVDLRKGNRLSSAQSRRCAAYYPDYEFD